MRETVADRALHRARACAVGKGFAVLGAMAYAMLVAACSTFGSSTPADQAAKDAAMGQQATLRPIGGSAITGKIRVVDRGDGAAVLVSAINFPYGAYRIAFHERGNCTSPNGFSAGPAWAPPASGKRPEDLVPVQYANSENRVETELRIPKLHATGVDGVAGRSVVLYAGTAVTELRPDVPNAAMACGVFEVARPPSFNF
jgi:Cu/Zn superoxide dismutase